MDFTPQLQDISEDSGYLTRATLEISSHACGENSSTLLYTETPTTVATSVSRKRKFSYQSDDKYNHKSTIDNSCESPARDLGTSSNFLSSTLNESLTKSLEKCYLESYTPNFYIERFPREFDNELSLKKYKLDDSPTYQPKTRSAPSTPTKHLEVEELSTKEKSQSEHLNGCHYMPPKSSGYKIKLGSPERLELLYPHLKPVTSPVKLKTPEKLREFIKRVNSPAKKRLFRNLQTEEKPFKKIDLDPVSVFSVKNDFRHVVSKIFGFLSDDDLCTVTRVSKSWKKALFSDHKAFPRYYSYSQKFNSNKENILGRVGLCNKPCSPPSPVRDSFHKCARIAAQLLPSQSLQKCIRCMEPAVIQKSISQCQNPNCEYIYCLNCSSFSTTGPEHFIDKCHTSELIVENKRNMYNRFGLCDISNGGNNTPSFLMNDSFNILQSKYDSSGYISESDISPIVRQNSNSVMNVKKKLVLSEAINRIENSVVCRKSRRSSLVPVVSPTSTPKMVELPEPASPPKIKVVACSKQSKRNLKRLNF